MGYLERIDAYKEEMLKTLKESVSKPSVGGEPTRQLKENSCRTDAEFTMRSFICYPRAKDSALKCITMIITQDI